jgi:adenylate cyclase
METAKSTLPKIAAGVAVGALCSALLCFPQAWELEQEIGLKWLFALRGPLTSPDNVALVTMNRQAAHNIYLPHDPEKYQRCEDLRVGIAADSHEAVPPLPSRWPRCLHAHLIEKLQRAGARIIVFDVLFRQRAPQVGLHGDANAEQDAALAKAMTSFGNVLIVQKFEQVPGTLNDEPLLLNPMISKAALGIGPFEVLPSTNRRVDTQQVFKEEGWATPGLPLLALQAYSIDSYPSFRQLLTKTSADAARLLPATVDELRRGQLHATSHLVQQLIAQDPALVERLRDAARQSSMADAHQLEILLAAYAGGASRLLNFIGPAGGIPSMRYDEALAIDEVPSAANQLSFAGKVVFVGYSETGQAEPVEHFSTVYSQPNGIDLSGVEIAATAFVNLMNDSSIRPPSAWHFFSIVFVTGLIVTVLCMLLGIRYAVPATMLLGAAYLGVALHVFAAAYIWLPLVIPVLVAVPAGLALSVIWKYVQVRAERDQVRKAFAQFVPRDVAAELERNANRIAATRRSLECACVATDAAKFTTLAEGMASEELADFLNQYFDGLFKPVVERSGFVSDVVGDAMLAIWPERDPDTRAQVCSALLEMREAADGFNQRFAGERMSTRFGANWGKVTLATVGARAHYEYRAVGDTVNTSNRIQDLNKKVGTRILVSQSLVAGVDGFLTRDLGTFQLRGRRTTERIVELIQKAELATEAEKNLVAEFASALALLESGAKELALAAFQGIQLRHPADGPVDFYIRRLQAGTYAIGNVVVVD